MVSVNPIADEFEFREGGGVFFAACFHDVDDSVENPGIIIWVATHDWRSRRKIAAIFIRKRTRPSAGFVQRIHGDTIAAGTAKLVLWLDLRFDSTIRAGDDASGRLAVNAERWRRQTDARVRLTGKFNERHVGRLVVDYSTSPGGGAIDCYTQKG